MAGAGCEEAQDHDAVSHAEILDLRLGDVRPADLLDEGTIVVCITWRSGPTIELTTAPVAPYELSRQCDPDDPEHTPLGPAPEVTTFRAGHQDDRIRICRRA